MDDTKAISLLKNRDIRGLEALVIAYQRSALKVAFVITRDQALAEDLVQAAFIRVFEKASQFDQRRPFGPWFNRIVRNDALKAAERRSQDVALDYGWAEGGSALSDLLPDIAASPHDLAEQAELQERVWKALTRLSSAQRAAIVDRYYLDLSEAESAERHGHSRGTVKQLLHRAKARLRSLLTAEGPDGVPAKEARDE